MYFWITLAFLARISPMKIATLGAVASTSRRYAITLAGLGLTISGVVNRAERVAVAMLAALTARQAIMIGLALVAVLADHIRQAVTLACLLVTVECRVVFSAWHITVTGLK